MTAMTARAPKLEARNRRVLRVLLGPNSRLKLSFSSSDIDVIILKSPSRKNFSSALV